MADLVTLAEYKAYANLLNTNRDAEILAVIPGISKLIRGYCRRSFTDYVSADKVEVNNGGFKELQLEEQPVISITSVEYSADYGASYTVLTSGIDYILDQAKGILVALNSTGIFPQAINGYTIRYKCGYATVPADLKLAAFDLITYYLKNDGAIHSSRSAGANALQIEYITTASLPIHIRRVLDLYVDNYL